MEKNNNIDLILEKISLVSLIQNYTKLERRGANYTGLCPFHQEKTPSFSVNEDKKFFHCFGCKASGNAIQFVMQIENIPFKEALQKTATIAGITLNNDFFKKSLAEREIKETLSNVNNHSALIFHQHLKKHPQQKALEYLKSRKINAKSINDFLLGSSPFEEDFLLKNLSQKLTLNRKELLQSSLFMASRQNSDLLLDKFRNKLIFPIHNIKAQIVGFGTRVLDNSLPKYINTGETPLFKKKEVLYGIYQAKDTIKKKEQVYLVEGYFDVIAMHQFGFTNTVGALGTSINEAHLKILKSQTPHITFLFDGDEAGYKAALRSLKICFSLGILPKIVLLPKSTDPYDYLFNYGAEAMEDLLDKKSYLWKDFLILPLKEESDTLKRRQAILETLNLLEKEDPFLRKEFLETLSSEFDIAIDTLEEYFHNSSKNSQDSLTSSVPERKKVSQNLTLPQSKSPTAKKKQEKRKDQAELTMALLFCYHPPLYQEYQEKISSAFFSSTDAKDIFVLFDKYFKENDPDFDIPEFIATIPDNLRHFFENIDQSLEYNPKKQIKDMYLFLKISSLQDKIQETKNLVQEFEQKQSTKKIAYYMEKLSNLRQQEESLKKERSHRHDL